MNTEQHDNIQIRDKNGIRTIRIHNPTRGNALNVNMALQLTEAFQEAEADEKIKAVVLRGLEGDPARDLGKRVFSSGMDMKEIIALLDDKQTTPATKEARLTQHCKAYADLFQTMYYFHKPIIGVAYGNATGMGATILMLCQHIIAGPDINISYPERNLGLWPLVSAPFVIGRIGIKAALQHFNSGEAFPVELMRGEKGGMEICASLNGIKEALKRALKPDKIESYRCEPASDPIELQKFPVNGDKLARMIAATTVLHQKGAREMTATMGAEQLADQLIALGPEKLAAMLQQGKSAKQPPKPKFLENIITPSPNANPASERGVG